MNYQAHDRTRHALTRGATPGKPARTTLTSDATVHRALRGVTHFEQTTLDESTSPVITLPRHRESSVQTTTRRFRFSF